MAYARYYVLLLLVITSIVFGKKRGEDTCQLENKVQLLQELAWRQGNDVGTVIEDVKILLTMLPEIMQQQQQQSEQINRAIDGIKQQQQQQSEHINSAIDELKQQQQQHREEMNGAIDEVKNEQQEMHELLQDHHLKIITNTAPAWCRDNRTGLTTIYVLNQLLSVFCDGKGGIVILRRVDSLHFTNRMWDSFKGGFGDPYKSFWLGLDNIHRLTTQYKLELLVELEDWDGNTREALYKHVHIGDENSGYKLSIANYTGNAGSSLSNHNGMKFSSPDKDNDVSSVHCAANDHGGWWYRNCYYSNLAGQYHSYDNHTSSHGLVWRNWKGGYYSLKRAQMTLVLR